MAFQKKLHRTFPNDAANQHIKVIGTTQLSYQNICKNAFSSNDSVYKSFNLICYGQSERALVATACLIGQIF